MNVPVIVIGGGGHARVLIETLLLLKRFIIGITDADVSKKGSSVRDISVLGDDTVLNGYQPNAVVLVNGIGSVHRPTIRKETFAGLKKKGFSFLSVIHPSAMIASDVVIGEGVQIMAGAVIQTGSKIGDDVIINTGAIIDHECSIGEHTHIAPGVTISGGARIGSHSHIGTGAVVIQGVSIGDRCMIGAGSVVVGPVPDNEEYLGVPARKKTGR